MGSENKTFFCDLLEQRLAATGRCRLCEFAADPRRSPRTRQINKRGEGKLRLTQNKKAITISHLGSLVLCFVEVCCTFPLHLSWKNGSQCCMSRDRSLPARPWADSTVTYSVFSSCTNASTRNHPLSVVGTTDPTPPLLD